MQSSLRSRSGAELVFDLLSPLPPLHSSIQHALFRRLYHRFRAPPAAPPAIHPRARARPHRPSLALRAQLPQISPPALSLHPGPEKTYKAAVNASSWRSTWLASSRYGVPEPPGLAARPPAFEISVQITGITGDVCTPPCAGTCVPDRRPGGVTATPVCALKDPTGKQYCILECTPSENKADGTNDACGAATCKAIQGVGVCTYDDR